MSKNLLPAPKKKYINFNNEPSFNETTAQLNALNSNNKKYNISNKTNTSIYNNSEEQYIQGDNQYEQKKLDYLNTHNKRYVSDADIQDIYDPLIEYDKNRNLIYNKLIQFNDYYVEINSRNREKEMKINIDTEYKLSKDPITLYKDSNLIYITHKNHNISKDDYIMIQGVTAQSYIRQYEPLNNNNYSIIFLENVKYIMIKFNHMISNTSNIDYYCSIENLTNPPNNIYIGNIPLTYLNGMHKIILQVSENIIFKDVNNNEYPAVYSPDRFYIELPYKYIPGTISDNTINSSMSRNYTLKLFYIYNVSIYELNAGFPVSEYQQNSYYIVKNVDKNGYYIQINTKASWDDDETEKHIGSNNIRVITIKSIEFNYPNTNNYTIKLPRSYKNIVKVEIVGSEFQNIENNIYKVENDQYDNNDFTTQQYIQNNKFYWQNYIDGSNYTYSIELPPGKYTPELLKSTIEDLVYKTPRIYYLQQQSADLKYTNNNIITVDFDINKNITTFKAFTDYIFNNAIIGLFYIHTDNNIQRFVKIDSTTININNSEQHYPLFLIIKCADFDKQTNNTYNNTNNDIVNGDNITIQNITSYYGIPGDILNNTYELYKVPTSIYTYNGEEYEELESLNTENYFMIKLPAVDMLLTYVYPYIQQNNQIEQHGGIFLCRMPLVIRILFNTTDTFGEIIGFSNTGNQNSITKWNSIITNQDMYSSDVGVSLSSSGKYLDFNGEKYINIVCKELSVFDNIVGIDNIFAKIMLKKSFNKTNYNTYTNNIKYFLTPINEINSLSFKFFNTRNMLCDFGNTDHSFIIKITTVNKSQLQTNISSYTGTQV